MANVVVEKITKEFNGGVIALDHLDLAIEDGEFFALLGPSGCGKTTLLRSIAGLERPTSGRVVIGGRDVTKTPPGARGLAMVFQDYALLPHMTVAENIAYPLKTHHVRKVERLAMATRTAENLGLEKLLARHPSELSGGQQQRVALARAITSGAKVLLLDEPLSNLDAQLRMEARTFVKRLQQELGITTIYVTHDQAEALALADRMAVMDHGKIKQLASPLQVYLRPADLFVAGFMGSTPINLLDGIVSGEGVRIGATTVEVPVGVRSHLSEGTQVVVGIRPEHVRLVSDSSESGIKGTVVVIEHLGDDDLVTLEGDGVVLRARVNIDCAPRRSDVRWGVPKPDRLLLFDRATGELVGGNGGFVESPIRLDNLENAVGNRASGPIKTESSI
jgi:multiple sugar transport system ATP-binding protein